MLLLWILLCRGLLAMSHALDEDLALGEWRLQLRSHQMEIIFPSVSWTTSGRNHGLTTKRRPFWKPQLCECHLSIFSNGTFALSTADDTSSLTTEASPRHRLCQMHGRWYAPNNPYCATDRFYQDVRLESYPRRLVATASHESRANLHSRQRKHFMRSRHKNRKEASLDSIHSPWILQRHRLVLHGRLTGHFARQQRQSRLTHGTVVQEELLTTPSAASHTSPLSQWWSHRRPVVASFVAWQLKSGVEDDDEEELDER